MSIPNLGVSGAKLDTIEAPADDSRRTTFGIDLDAPIPFVPALRETERTFGDLLADAYAEIDRVEDAADAWGHALRREQDMADAKAREKEAAIARLMAANTATKMSYTGAEKIVESDPGYTDVRKQQGAAVLESKRHEGQFAAAKLRARLSVSLAERATLAPLPAGADDVASASRTT